MKKIYSKPTIKMRAICDYESPLLAGSIDSNIGVGGGDIDNDGSHDPDAKGGFVSDEGSVGGSVWE